MSTLGLLSLAVLWPLLLVCLLGFRTTRSLALPLAPWAALPALAASLLVAPSEVRWHISGILLGSEIGLDATGQVFLLLAALLWAVSGVYARAYLSQSTRHTEFYIFFLLSMAGNFGLIVAQDLFGFYLGFALMSFAAYGLIIFVRSTAALRAGRIYIVLVVAGELMLFVALLMTAEIADATTFDAMRAGLALADPGSRNWVILLGVAGFGIKAGVLGLHVWLPLAHPVAPAPASAVLSGTMIKAGLLGWLRLLPLGEIALPGWGVLMMMLGLTAAFYGVVIGLTQREPKILLAYSSISQMGVMTMSLGLGMLSPQAWPLILPTIAFYALHHGLSKGALFLGVGLSGGAGRIQRRWIWLGLWLPALTLAGAPWTSGMLAKQLLKTHTHDAPLPWDSLLPLLLSISALATALLMLRLLYLVRPAVAAAPDLTPAVGLTGPWVVSLLAVLLVPWWLASDMPDLGSVVIYTMDSLWPVLVALMVAWVVLRLDFFRTIQPLPAGDVLVLMGRGSRLFYTLANALSCFGVGWKKWQMWFKLRLTSLVMAAKERFQSMEDHFARWEVAMLFLVIVVLSMGLLVSR
ncbi:MAG: proton-conducting transporter membrane subunit [Nitrosomonas sp.]|nr:proton-conducting transporter membrane subunit [Nitrosomonas sp.]MDP1950638.1 proton-conducting transporter membrane subunit [Nitrosomonas sp.]